MTCCPCGIDKKCLKSVFDGVISPITSGPMKNCRQNVDFPNTGFKSLMLSDYWCGHWPEVISEVTLSNTNFKQLSIPAGTTGQKRPLVFGFRIWKNFIIRFSDQVVLYQYDVNNQSSRSFLLDSSIFSNIYGL